MKTLLIFLSLILFTFATNLKKAIYEQRIEWEASNADHQDCWWQCTDKKGYSCAFGYEGRKTSEFYQCVDTEQHCKDWLDSYYVCKMSHCIPWRYSNPFRIVINC